MKRLYFLFILLNGLTTFAQENPPVFETVVEDVVFNSSSRVVLDEKTIKQSHSPNITTLLASQANITITNTPFQPNSIYVRGGDSGHVLILVDGVPFYDASTIQRTIDLNSLDIKSVRRIEIIKGSQTVLYGGQALSGVIKIDTIPQDIGTKTVGIAEVGTQNSRDLTAVHSDVASDLSGVILRGHGSWKDAESPVLHSSKTYNRNNWNGDGTYLWKGPVEGNVKATFLQDLNYSPSSDITYQIVDTDDFKQYTRQMGFSSNIKFNDMTWTPRLSLSSQNSLREFNQPATAANPFVTDQKIGGNLRTVRLDATPYKNEILVLSTGLSYVYEDFVYRDLGAEVSNASAEQRGLFIKGDYKFSPNVEMALGGRVENWASHAAVGTYQLGFTLFQNTKLEVSTGYKIPSLYQLYSAYGNPDLKEERATQYSVTQEFQLSEKQQLSVSLFNSDFSNLIVAQGTYPAIKYQNVNKSETRGIEWAYSWKPTESSTFFATYGYQEPRDIDASRWLLRRPLVNGSIKYLQNWDRHSGTFEILATGERLDRNSNTSLMSIPGYAIANASYAFNVSRGFNVYARLNNLLDYRYQETYSYFTEGFSGFTGIDYTF